ncbi:MAG TPA: hypothetical protein VMI55_00090 [Thermoplasmata archaeon]|nr:hypothetical protein [Thermoplasmata archaeon]
MTGPSRTFDAPTDRLEAAIARAGLTGVTVKQLVATTRLPVDQVHQGLDRLAAARSIARHGRGLWALSRYESDRPPPSSFRGPAWYVAEFEREFGLRVGGAPTEIQSGGNDRRPVHRWWPYVQGFSAGFVESICRRYGVGPGTTVLDPFCGSGTVPTTARALGARGVGVDLMPIAAFVARAKGEWDVDPREFWEQAERVLRRRARGTLQPPFLRETRRQFDPAVLRSLLRLKESVWATPDGGAGTLLRLAFASILIDSSHLKRAPCLGYTTKVGLDGETPYRLFRERTQAIREDLVTLQNDRASWGPRPEIHGESSASVVLEENSVDLSVTSPPYVNGMDYVMNYKIDLAWMDFVRSYDELAKLRGAMVACDNIPRSVAADHRPSAAVRSDRWLTSIVRAIERNVRSKGSYRRHDMAAVVAKYFDDLVPVISAVHRALRPGARFVVVNGDSLMAGTYVPGDLLFARLAAGAGFEVESFEVARSRRSGQRRGFRLRESVLTLRKPAALG